MLLRQNDTVIKKIFESYEKDLGQVEESLIELFKSNVFLIPLIGKYLVEGGGKRMRPLFLLLSARLCGYKGYDAIPLAGIIESIHTASLLHDDVVDGADLRRGRTTAHSLWGNEVVILVGDFLYSNALRRSVSFNSIKLVEAVSYAVNAMTEGELLQLEKSGDINITEDEYMKIISSKTGILMSAACRIGGILGGVAPELEDALARFGQKAGITFQMADDILDYHAEDGFGKKLGKDLEEGKITLPLLYLIREAAERDEINSIVESPSEAGLKRIMELFEKYKVLPMALDRAHSLLQEAKGELSAFRDCPERQDLLALADYALQREH
jgi:octaprenyl-diphosphate synthase